MADETTRHSDKAAADAASGGPQPGAGVAAPGHSRGGRAPIRDAEGPAAGRPDRNEPPKKPWYRRPLPMGILILVLVVVAVGGTLWWRHSRTYEKTDDAFIDVVVQRVSPQVAGRVSRVLVNDNQDVSAGQGLLELDPADFDARVQQARAAVAQAEAQVAQAAAQRTIRSAEVDQARAAETAVATTATNAAADLRRLEQARKADEGTASAQQVDHARAEQRGSAAQQQAAAKAVAAAQAQLALVSRQIEAAKAAAESAKAQLAQAELAVSYTEVKAEVAGRVADKTVTVGDMVQPGSDLMAIVPRTVYVTADFKETQLARLRPGQPVDIKVDAYPDLPLHGHVDSVQPATGGAFTPIPAQNASGNWVKVVQRVPVKIAIDDLPDDPLRRLGPGMSVEVKVQVETEDQRPETRDQGPDGR